MNLRDRLAGAARRVARGAARTARRVRSRIGTTLYEAGRRIRRALRR